MEKTPDGNLKAKDEVLAWLEASFPKYAMLTFGDRDGKGVNCTYVTTRILSNYLDIETFNDCLSPMDISHRFYELNEIRRMAAATSKPFDFRSFVPHGLRPHEVNISESVEHAYKCILATERALNEEGLRRPLSEMIAHYINNKDKMDEILTAIIDNYIRDGLSGQPTFWELNELAGEVLREIIIMPLTPFVFKDNLRDNLYNSNMFQEMIETLTAVLLDWWPEAAGGEDLKALALAHSAEWGALMASAIESSPHAESFSNFDWLANCIESSPGSGYSYDDFQREYAAQLASGAGSAQNDTLLGSRGDDILAAGDGDDLLIAAGGNDTLVGGAGYDVYVLGDVFGEGLEPGMAAIIDGDGQGEVVYAKYVGAGVPQGGIKLRLRGGRRVAGGNDNSQKFQDLHFEFISYVYDPGSGALAIYDGETQIAQINSFSPNNKDLGITLIDFSDARPDGYASLSFGANGYADNVIMTASRAGENHALDGGDGRDVIYGGHADERFWGGAETDFLSGNYGADALYGQAGRDILLGGPRHAATPEQGRADTDLLVGGSGSDIIFGGDGDDVIFAGDEGEEAFQAEETASAEGSGEWLMGGGGNDKIYGGQSQDFISGGAGSDLIYGGGGDDVILGDGDYVPRYQMTMTPAGTVIPGYINAWGVWVPEIIVPLGRMHTFNPNTGAFQTLSAASSQIVHPRSFEWRLEIFENLDFSGAADYKFFDYQGENPGGRLAEGGGADIIYGGAGNDWIAGQTGADYIDGGAGDDIIHGRDVDDLGPPPENSSDPSDDNDTLIGGGGADKIYGGSGHDVIYGDILSRDIWGRDILEGDGEADEMFGGAGDDTLYAGTGGDRLYGEWGADTLVAGASSGGLFDGGSGDDTLVVGFGSGNSFLGDTYSFSVDYLKAGSGWDTIADSDGQWRLMVDGKLINGLTTGLRVVAAGKWRSVILFWKKMALI